MDERKAIIESTPEAREAFGECWGANPIELDKDDLVALVRGKTIATTINMREYTVFIRLSTNCQLEDLLIDNEN